MQEIDGEQTMAVARLTEREKDVLRRWLDHKTAKEMALDLGISHYAVEKRLRIARAKLGVSTSIEAARMLEAAEGYKRVGAQAPDLADQHSQYQAGLSRPLTLGVVTMILIATATFALMTQGTESTNTATFDPDMIRDRVMVKATEAEIAHVTQATFQHQDADDSGFIEGDEAPVSGGGIARPVFRRNESGEAVRTGETVTHTHEELIAGFYEEADRDGDGKVSYPEYHQWHAPHVARSGIPIEWRENMMVADDPAPISDPSGEQTRAGIVRRDYDPQEMVEATPAEILVIVQNTFAAIDADDSRYIDGAEVGARFGEGGTSERPMPTPAEYRAQFYASADVDGDGRVALDEYRRWASPSIARMGIPKDWKEDINRPIPSDPT